MRSLGRVQLLSIFLVIFMSFPASAFFGSMMSAGRKMMGVMSGGMMDPAKMMLQMCGTGPGQMAGGAMNMMGSAMSMMPMGRSAVRGMSAEAMQQVLQDPNLTLKAMECAKRNDQMVNMMLKTLSGQPRLLHQMADAMVRDSRIARSMMDLALMKRAVGDYLLSHMDAVVFNSLSYAMIIHKGMAADVSLLVWQHRESALRIGTRLTTVFRQWGRVDVDYDGTEYATEMFLYATFSDIDAANIFMAALEDRDKQTREYILDIIFLGKVKNYYYDPIYRVWSDAEFKTQSFRNLYSIIYAMNASLATPINGVDPSESKAGKQLMGNMMKYMIDHESKRPTRWGNRLMMTLVAGSQGHEDPRIANFARFLMELMPPRFTNSLPPSIGFETPVPDYTRFQL